VPTIQMDLVADDRCAPPAKRVKWVEDFNLEPQTPGIMASPRMRAAGVRLRSAPSSPPPCSTISIRKLGLPTCWPARRIINQPVLLAQWKAPATVDTTAANAI
jgi:hypothetical protein